MPRLKVRFAGTWARNTVWCALIFCGVAAALLLGGLRPLDDVFASLRFNAIQREASQSLTVVEIDSRSLEAAGSWPWDRTRYAQAIDSLVEAGAILVSFDVDFSAASNPTADQALADAISRHPGQVALANFMQNDSYASETGRVAENIPIEPLRRDALLASVNVPVDSDGKVRRYEYSGPAGRHPSVAALLAGSSTRDGAFQIDYGIDRRTVAHISFEDVLRKRFNPALVSGRVVLIGATALELGDEFATPAGLLPGVVIHALAYESIVGGRALLVLQPLALLLMCVALGLCLLPARGGGKGLQLLVARHGIAAAVLLALPIALQAMTPVSLQAAPLVLTQLLFGIWATRVELARRARAIIDEREAGLRHLAMHQSETALPNRRALLQDIADAWRSQPDRSLSVFTIGVERYSEMRGVVGYAVANRLVAQLAKRLAEVAGVASVAHVATSVLAFSRSGLSRGELDGLLQRLQDLETNFLFEGYSIDIFLRAGAAMEEHPVSPEVLLERATRALNAAERSQQRVAVFDPATFGSPANNLALMSEMHQAIASGNICLHYQPKMTLTDGSIASVEALCRWWHPVRGFVPPDEFIPIAEETGRIRALTEWTLMQAIKDQARLRASGKDITVALNISGRLLADEGFKAKALELTQSIDTNLCFEITETAVIQHPGIASDAIAAYRAAGIKISIDDYGSGLSSLSYLKMLNADELKIDKSLVVDVMKSQRDRLIMKSTIDLAHGLGMSVVAEGVETEALALSLKLMGCDVVQGYWISRPMPLSDVIGFLRARQSEEEEPELSVACQAPG